MSPRYNHEALLALQGHANHARGNDCKGNDRNTYVVYKRAIMSWIFRLSREVCYLLEVQRQTKNTRF